MEESGEISAEAMRGTGSFAVEDAAGKGVEETRRILDRLILAHEGYFDITRPFSPGWSEEARFDALAEFHQSAEKYVLSKKAKLWGCSTHEYILFKRFGHLDEGRLRALIDDVESHGVSLVSPDEDHMVSYLSVVAIAESVGSAVPSIVRKTRFRKNISFGFKGWIDLRLAVIDVAGASVHVNGQGKAMKGTLEANAFR